MAELVEREYDADGFCSVCHHPRHSLWRFIKGWLAWHLVCDWWLSTRLWWKWGIIPPFLATAGDCIFDCRSCRHEDSLSQSNSSGRDGQAVSMGEG